MPAYCFIIPVLNEKENIEDLTAAILKVCKENNNFLILYIDDGSTDGTIEFLENKIKGGAPLYLIKRKKKLKGCRRGKALRDGIQWAVENTDASFFIEMDGDLSHVPEEIPFGLEMLHQQYDIVIASKFIKGSKIIGRPWYRNFISLINSVLLRLMISRKIRDYSNGFRFYNIKAARIILKHPIRQQGPLYLGEVLSIWLKQNLKISEIPSCYYDRNKGSSKVIISDIFRGLTGALSVCYHYHFTIKKI